MCLKSGIQPKAQAGVEVLNSTVQDLGKIHKPQNSTKRTPHSPFLRYDPTMKIFLVDAFTNRIFGGNPAAVVPLESWLPSEQMQQMASEHNQSETAFFVPESQGFRLRWFTPRLEIDFCGHATLASAKVLFDELKYPQAELVFYTRVGELRVRKVGQLLEMDFPTFAAEPVPDPPQSLLLSVSETPKAVFKNSGNYYLLLESEAAVRRAIPNFLELSEVHPHSVCITAQGDSADFVSRFFAPSYGVPEDPVTGSIHATLTPFWAARLGKQVLHARQVSQRGGVLECEMAGERVLIRGQAVVYLRGEIVD
jgi:PhzF family phenazine biosynthesis protein